MNEESSLWEDFLNVTEGVFIVTGMILTVANMLTKDDKYIGQYPGSNE